MGALRDVSGTVPDGTTAAAAIRVRCRVPPPPPSHQFSRSFRAVRLYAVTATAAIARTSSPPSSYYRFAIFLFFRDAGRRASVLHHPLTVTALIFFSEFLVSVIFFFRIVFRTIFFSFFTR